MRVDGYDPRLHATSPAYLRRVGVRALWLKPVLQNCQEQNGSYHGYGIRPH
jgi:hypothetical protein